MVKKVGRLVSIMHYRVWRRSDPGQIIFDLFIIMSLDVNTSKSTKYIKDSLFDLAFPIIFYFCLSNVQSHLGSFTRFFQPGLQFLPSRVNHLRINFETFPDYLQFFAF